MTDRGRADGHFAYAAMIVRAFEIVQGQGKVTPDFWGFDYQTKLAFLGGVDEKAWSLIKAARGNNYFGSRLAECMR